MAANAQKSGGGQEEQSSGSALAPQFMTTEHFTLQTARANTISESNGRSSLFIGALSSSLVALGFIAQISEMGAPFYIFSFILLPFLVFLGTFTFMRLLETAIEDMNYAVAMARIRSYFVEQAPEIERYFLLPTHDDPRFVFESMETIQVPIPGLQILLTNAGLISVINSILLGILTGLILIQAAEAAPLGIIGVGAIIFAVSLFFHTRYQQTQWKNAEAKIQPIAPAPSVANTPPAGR